MLNGKFYTGLTAKQLARPQSGAPDRLKSSFYWPDETDAQPATQHRVTSRAARQSAIVAADKRLAAERSAASAAAAAAATGRPKELFQQQLTSKIEFCDDLKLTPKPRRRGGGGGGIGGIATAQDLSDIAASIEKPVAARDRSTNRRKAMQTSIGPAKQQQQQQQQQHQQQPTKAAAGVRKTITFAEPKRAQPRPGILKNNEVLRPHRVDYVVEPIPVYKKNIVPRGSNTAAGVRLQLSKSMDNFARLDIAAAAGAPDGRTKRNNVEHEREQREQRRHANDDDDDDAEEEAEVTENAEDYAEREYYEKWGDTVTETTTATASETNETSVGQQQQQQQQRVQRRNEHEHSAVRREYANQNGHGRFAEARQHHSQALTDVIGYAKHYADVKQAPQPSGAGRRHVQRDEPVPVSVPESVPSPAVSAGRRYYPNEAAVRAQSHLRSNIFFDDGPSAASYGGGGGGGVDRPRSVRDAAVCRVGVGLPNI